MPLGHLFFKVRHIHYLKDYLNEGGEKQVALLINFYLRVILPNFAQLKLVK